MLVKFTSGVYSLFYYFATGSYYVDKAGLELTEIHLHLLLCAGIKRLVPPHPARYDLS